MGLETDAGDAEKRRTTIVMDENYLANALDIFRQVQETAGQTVVELYLSPGLAPPVERPIEEVIARLENALGISGEIGG